MTTMWAIFLLAGVVTSKPTDSIGSKSVENTLLDIPDESAALENLRLLDDEFEKSGASFGSEQDIKNILEETKRISDEEQLARQSKNQPGWKEDTFTGDYRSQPHLDVPQYFDEKASSPIAHFSADKSKRANGLHIQYRLMNRFHNNNKHKLPLGLYKKLFYMFQK
eukprot:gene8315-14279_t